MNVKLDFMRNNRTNKSKSTIVLFFQVFISMQAFSKKRLHGESQDESWYASLIFMYVFKNAYVVVASKGS